MNLYQLTQELQTAFDRLEIDPETGEITNFDVVDNLNIAFEQKCEGYAIVIKNKLAMIAEIKQEIKTLQERCKSLENNVSQMQDRLSTSMQSVNLDRLETARACVSFHKSTQVNITDIDRLPYGYVTEKVERKPDKTAIKKALASGEAIAGAELVTKSNIQIK